MGNMRRANRESDESEVADYIDLLCYMVKRCDPDGIDLHYFNSAKVIKRCKRQHAWFPLSEVRSSRVSQTHKVP